MRRIQSRAPGFGEWQPVSRPDFTLWLQRYAAGLECRPGEWGVERARGLGVLAEAAACRLTLDWCFLHLGAAVFSGRAHGHVPIGNQILG